MQTSERNRKWYKNCFVPSCGNNSKTTPEKMFISVKKDRDLRIKWFEAVKRQGKLSVQSTLYCCADHFHSDDIENLIQYRLMGNSTKLRLKPGVIPQIFKSQQVEDVLGDDSFQWQDEVSSCDKDIQNSKNINDSTPTCCSNELIKEEPVFVSESHHDMNIKEEYMNDFTSTLNENIAIKEEPIDDDTETLCADIDIKDEYYSNDLVSAPQVYVPETNCAVEDSIPKTRDASVQTENSCDCGKVDCCFLKFSTSATSVLRWKVIVSPIMTTPINTSVCWSEPSECNTDSESDIDLETDSNDSRNLDAHLQKKTKCLVVTRMLIDRNSEMCLNSDKNLLFGCKNVESPERNIFLTLMKIQLNDSFYELGTEFNISRKIASQIFKKTVGILSHYLQNWIYWRPRELPAKKHLPILLRHSKLDKMIMIDCLEFRIAGFSHPPQGAHSPSDSEKCNIVKYLISTNADGYITFISKGYAGCVPDTVLLLDSKFLEEVPVGYYILDEKGLMDNVRSLDNRNTVARSLHEKTHNIDLVTIDQVIARITEFSLLKKHDFIRSTMLRFLDDVVCVVCGLVNMESSVTD